MSNIFQIEEARREGSRLVIALAAISGNGKTRSALELAYGLTRGDASKIGFVCTENRRGRLYADVLKNKDGKIQRFRIGDLVAPFSPQRYIDAIEAFTKAGVEVLIVDSVSHEWEGTGGCEEIAAADKKNGWLKAKAEHKRFMNALLQSPMHIIACLRAREKTKVVKRADGKTDYEPLGVLPVCEKNFMFETTVSLMLWGGGRQREVLKCPGELEHIFGTTGTMAEGYLTPRDGLAVRKWVDGGTQADPAQAAHDALQLETEKGEGALVAAWNALPDKTRAAIGQARFDVLLESARAFDAQRAGVAEEDGASELSAMLSGQGSE